MHLAYTPVRGPRQLHVRQVPSGPDGIIITMASGTGCWRRRRRLNPMVGDAVNKQTSMDGVLSEIPEWHQY